MSEIKKDGLAIYKGSPVKVCSVDKKIEIELLNGSNKSVRDKDILIIHPGPVASLSIPEKECDIEEVWTLLEGEETNLLELAEFLYGDGSVNSAYNTYNHLIKDLYFSGSINSIQCNSREHIDSIINKEQLKEQKLREYKDSIERLSKGEWTEDDSAALREIEDMALEQRTQSKVLKELGIKETSLDAHRFLLKISYWSIERNPHPGRMGVSLRSTEKRDDYHNIKNPLDLTHLESYAIDDEGSKDPDDAVSYEGDDKLWVHITDVASLVSPGSSGDLDASSKGSNLYLPTKTVHMLPKEVTELQGLGLMESNNTISFMFQFDSEYNIIKREIHLARVKVKRYTYEEVEKQREDIRFKRFYDLAKILKERREAAGAISISLPEVKIRVNDKISIKPIRGIESRDVISELMLLAGESAAIFCSDNQIPIPYACQLPPDAKGKPEKDLASMFVWRRKFKRGETKFLAEPHAGLGLKCYTRATSPIRRYTDLVVNQQLRAYLLGDPLQSEEELLLKTAPALESMRTLAQCERASNLYWKIIYISRNMDREYIGTYVEKKDKNSGVFLIEDLALETVINLKEDLELNCKIPLRVKKIDIPTSQVTFIGA